MNMNANKQPHVIVEAKLKIFREKQTHGYGYGNTDLPAGGGNSPILIIFAFKKEVLSVSIQVGYHMEKCFFVFPPARKKVFDGVRFDWFDPQTFPHAGVIGKLYAEPFGAEIILQMQTCAV